MLDATKAIRPGARNRLAVRVVNPNHQPIDGIVLNETPHRNKMLPYTSGNAWDQGGICDSVELLIVPPDWSEIVFHSVVPRLDGAGSLTLAVGIVGATVMPHAIYLHSSLTQDRIVARNIEERLKLIRFSNREVMLALGLAGLVNMSMVAMAAANGIKGGGSRPRSRHASATTSALDAGSSSARFSTRAPGGASCCMAANRAPARTW